MKRFLHIQRYRSLVLVALAVLWAAFMMISSPAVIADKGGKGNPHDTSGTTPTGDTSGTTPTGDTNEDTSGDGELGLPHTDEYLCLNFGLNCSLSPARDTGWHFEDYLAYCLSWELDPFNGECYDPMGGYS